MEFIETQTFTEIIKSLMNDDDYAALQQTLIRDPAAGDLISGGGGLRKVRWMARSRNKGKRSGVRVIYFIRTTNSLLMLFAFGKDQQDDLTRDQLKVLRLFTAKGVL